MAIAPKAISDLKMIDLRYRTTTGHEYLNFHVFGGLLYIRIMPEKEMKPIFSRKLRFEDFTTFTSVMTSLLKAEPNTEKTLVVNDYNRQEKKIVLDYVIIFKKDERKVLHICIKQNGNTWDAAIRTSPTICYGTGEIPEDERSIYAWMNLISAFNNLFPVELQLSSFAFDGQNGGGNGGGNYNRGNYNRGGGNYGGQAQPQPQPEGGEFKSVSDLPTDDDIFQ